MFLIITVLFFCSSYAQDRDNDEYEIYGKLIGERGLQFYPIDFEIPDNLKLNIKDSIYREIKKIKIMPINQKKIFDTALKYSIKKTFKMFEYDKYNHIYISPIYFKSKTEAYFIYMRKSNLPKPYIYFYQAIKDESEWFFSDYYVIW